MAILDNQLHKELQALSCPFKYYRPEPEACGTLMPGRRESWELVDECGAAQAISTPGGEIVDGKYRLQGMIGVGGMGSVYRARHLFLQKEVALKTFRTARFSSSAWQRFQREAQAIARLSHANIVQVFDGGICEGNMPYFTMELLRGQTLADRLKKYGRLNLETALPIFRAVASALAHAHKQDIVHCDIKPGNIFLDQSCVDKTVVKVVDFGLAQLAAQQAYAEMSEAEANIIVGSPLYMSPEQATADAPDWRTDIYSFGCALYDALAGRPPFVGATAFETIQMHLSDVPPLMVEANRALEYNKPLEEIMSRLLAKDRIDRYQSFDAVLCDLYTLELGEPLECFDKHADNSGERADYSGAHEEHTPVREKYSGELARSSLTKLPPSPAPDAVPPVEAQAHAVATPSRLISLAVLGLIAAAVMVVSFIFAPQMHAISKTKAIELGCIIPPLESCYSGPKFSCVKEDGSRQFTFPVSSDLGYISWEHKAPFPASRIVTIPPGKHACLEVSRALSMRPELLDRFRRDDLYGIACRDYSDWSDEFLEGIVKNLSDVKLLELTGCSLDNSCIEQLNQLRMLEGLSVRDTDITGYGLAKLNRLQELKFLDASQSGSTAPLLAALKNSKNLTSLTMEDCNLSPAEVDSICTLHKLNFLNINHTNLSLQSLRHLAGLRNLTVLSIADSNLNPDCIEVLHQFKGLQKLRIDFDHWSGADVQRLQKAVPANCTLENKRVFPGWKSFMRNPENN